MGMQKIVLMKSKYKISRVLERMVETPTVKFKEIKKLIRLWGLKHQLVPLLERVNVEARSMGASRDLFQVKYVPIIPGGVKEIGVVERSHDVGLFDDGQFIVITFRANDTLSEESGDRKV